MGWQLCRNRDLCKAMRSGVHCVAFSPDGTKFASGSDDKTIQLWDSQTFTPLANRFGDISRVSGVLHFPPIVPRLHQDQQTTRFDCGTQRVVLQSASRSRGIQTSSLHLRFYLMAHNLCRVHRTRQIRLWNTVTGAAFGEPSQHSEYVTCVAISQRWQVYCVRFI